jgi:hypothetical protein
LSSSQAIASGSPLIPADSLSLPHPVIHLPKHIPTIVMAQPFIEAHPVFVVAPVDPSSVKAEAEAEAGEGPSFPGGPAAWTTALESLVVPSEIEVEWASAGITEDDDDGDAQRRRWVEVSIGLLGSLGDMTPLGPSVSARLKAEGPSTGQAGEAEADEDGGGVGTLHPSEVVHLVPVPRAVASAAALDAARARAVIVADHLGLSGLVRLDAFMNVDSGELAVLAVEPVPDLSDRSPLYAQARRGWGWGEGMPLYAQERRARGFREGGLRQGAGGLHATRPL